MALIEGNSYYVSVSSTVLRKSGSKSSTALNHLLLGDWMLYLGEETANWAKMKCRGCKGWIPKADFTENRLLEINFVDIGQGDGCHIVTPEDEIMLIDAGEGDNMYRFLSWRYNLRGRKVVGVDGVQEGDENTSPPMDIEHIVITHPDEDHYYGFRHLFADHKVKPLKIYHSGIVERPISSADKNANLRYYSNDDLGGYLEADDGTFIWDVVHSNTEMHALINKHSSTRKHYISTLKQAKDNNNNVKFASLNKDSEYLPGFEANKDLRLKVLGPITETQTFEGQSKKTLIRLGAESISKNGHSVVLQLQIGHLKVMLGGDLNTQSEDYLLKTYSETTQDVSELEERLYELKAKGANLDTDEAQELAEVEADIAAIITKGRRELQVDVTKACHHGSHHFSETFLQDTQPNRNRDLQRRWGRLFTSPPRCARFVRQVWARCSTPDF